MNRKRAAAQPLAVVLTAGAMLLRLAPHPPNFAPVGGAALFSGSRVSGWLAYLVPLIAMLVTDPILSHMAGYPAYSPATLVIYASMLGYVLLGRLLLRNTQSYWRIVPVSLLGSVQFFAVTNLYEWWAGLTGYPHTVAGLITCYTAALPFFGWTAAGDLVYAAGLFAIYEVLSRRISHDEAYTSSQRI